MILKFSLILLGLVVVGPLAMRAELREEVVSQREDLRLLQEKFGQVQNDVQAMKGDHEGILADVERLKKDLKEVRNSLDVLKGEIARLDELIKKLDALREQDRKTIVEEVGREISRLEKKSSRAEPSHSEKSSPPRVQEGVEHIVEKGQTLNAIAEAYGVTKKAIMEANKLAKPDLKVGQKLFIPVVSKADDPKKKTSKSRKSSSKPDEAKPD